MPKDRKVSITNMEKADRLRAIGEQMILLAEQWLCDEEKQGPLPEYSMERLQIDIPKGKVNRHMREIDMQRWKAEDKQRRTRWKWEDAVGELIWEAYRLVSVKLGNKLHNSIAGWAEEYRDYPDSPEQRHKIGLFEKVLYEWNIPFQQQREKELRADTRYQQNAGVRTTRILGEFFIARAEKLKDEAQSHATTTGD